MSKGVRISRCKSFRGMYVGELGTTYIHDFPNCVISVVLYLPKYCITLIKITVRFQAFLNMAQVS